MFLFLSLLQVSFVQRFNTRKMMHEFQISIISGRKPEEVRYLPEINFLYFFRYIMQNHYIL